MSGSIPFPVERQSKWELRPAAPGSQEAIARAAADTDAGKRRTPSLFAQEGVLIQLLTRFPTFAIVNAEKSVLSLRLSFTWQGAIRPLTSALNPFGWVDNSLVMGLFDDRLEVSQCYKL